MDSDGIGLRQGFHLYEARKKIPRAQARGASKYLMGSLNKNNTLVVIPAFNEEHNISIVIAEVNKYFNEGDIAVINDGSCDKTAQNALKNNVIVLNHPFNMGIGVSFQTGCQFALAHDYDYIVRIDADGQHDPKFIHALINFIKDNDVDIVVGSRFLARSNYKTPFFRLLGILVISFALRIISNKKITDPTSGFCAMNRKAFEFFSQNCADDYPEPEILMHQNNFAIKEVPIPFNKRYHGASSITFFKSIYYMIKVLLSLFVETFR